MFDRPTDYGKPQTGPSAVFRGEEGLKGPALPFGIHPAAIVDHLDTQTFRANRSKLELDLGAANIRVRCVADEIKNALLKQRPVDEATTCSVYRERKLRTAR